MRIVEIQTQVAEYYHLKLVDMQSRDRKWRVSRPRQIAMYLCRELTNRSYSEIAQAFGKGDHTTVIHGVREVGTRIQQDTTVAEAVAAIRRRLNEG